MSHDNIEKTLKLAGDMQAFGPPEDALTDIIRESTEAELSEADLDLVAAAAKPMSFQEFLKRAGRG